MRTASRIQTVNDGPEFSRIVAGMMRLNQWGLSNTELLNWLKAIIDMGVTTIDHADIYGSFTCERLFGEAIALEPSIRDKLEIVTKCDIRIISENRPENHIPHYDTSKDYIIWSAENSLKQLRTDHIDVLLIHRPDFLMQADEVAEAFAKLKRDGKVLHFGVSNFTNPQFELLSSRLDFPLVTNQVELSIMQMSALTDGSLDLAQQLAFAPMIWSPFGGGSIFRADTEQATRVKAVLEELANHHKATIDQIALAWILRHPAKTIPVIGTGKLTRIQSAVEAESISLTRQEWYALWVASTGHNVP